MKHTLLAAVMAVTLSACAGDKATRATNSLAIACETYGTALKQLAPLRKDGTLGAGWVSKIDASNKLVDPVCLPGSKVDPAMAVNIVESGIALLGRAKNAL